MPTLLDITDDIRRLESTILGLIDEGEVDFAGTLLPFFDGLHEDRARKLEGYCHVIRALEGEAAALNVHINAVRAKMVARENAASRLKTRLHDYLIAEGITKIDAGVFTLSVQANGGSRPLKLADDLDLNTVPEPYIVVTRTLNVAAVRNALEAGEDVPFAALADRGTHLRIR